MKFDENQRPKELFFLNDTPKSMTTFDFTINDTPKLISARKKAPPKMAHPIPAYMVVTPPPPGAILIGMIFSISQKDNMNTEEFSFHRSKTEIFAEFYCDSKVFCIVFDRISLSDFKIN